MNEFQIKTLWGENFHLVERGLSEADVVAFVEKLMERQQAESDKLQHVPRRSRPRSSREPSGWPARSRLRLRRKAR